MPSNVPDQLKKRIRSEVRSERPYVVSGASGLDVKLNQNESPFDLPPELKKEVLQDWFEIPFNRYPTEQPDRLVAELTARLEVAEGSILVGNGSNELTHTLGLCFVRPGSAVVLPRPMFALYESVVRLYGGRVVAVAPREDLCFDAQGLLEAVRTHQPDLTILTSPNNPTGRAMAFDDIESICREARGFVVVDEAYFEFNTERPALDLLNKYANLIVLRTLSKAFGLAGLRIGYLVAHPEITAELLKARLPFMVDRLSESVAISLLRHQDLIDERIVAIRKSTASLYDELSQLTGVDVIPSSTNFLLFQTEEAPHVLAATLAEAGVLVRNMAGYPELKGYLRVTAGTESENKAFLDALKSTL